MNPSSPLPLYEQLKQQLRRRIALGEWRTHQTIPAERNLVQEYGVSRITVQKALADLVQEGVLYRRHGKGTFISPPVIGQKVAGLTGFAEELMLQGLAPEIEVLSDFWQPAPPAAAAALQLVEGTPVRCIRRRVTAEAGPVFCDEIYLPDWVASRIGADAMLQGSIYQSLEQHGITISRGEQRIAATTLNEANAFRLGVAPGAATLRVCRTTFTAAEQPVEYAEVTYRADRYEYVLELRRRTPLQG